MNTHEMTEFFVQFLPKKTSWGKIIGARAVRLTASKPEKPEPGAYVLKIKLDIPPSIFDPPEAVLELKLHDTEKSLVQLAQDLKNGN